MYCGAFKNSSYTYSGIVIYSYKFYRISVLPIIMKQLKQSVSENIGFSCTNYHPFCLFPYLIVTKGIR